MREEREFRLGGWRVNPITRVVERPGVRRRLEPRVMELLVHLARSGGEPVSRQDVERALWPAGGPGADTLNRAMSKLRKALDDPDRPGDIIETIPRYGYRLTAPVTWEPEPQPAEPDPRRWTRATVRFGLPAVALVGSFLLWASISETRPPNVVADTYRLTPLTTEPGYEMAPTLSPDGAFVAYQRFDKTATPSRGWDIVVRAVGATTSVDVAASVADEYEPAWDPTTDSVAFVRQSPDECHVDIVSRAGGSRTIATCRPDASHELAWTPDGGTLLLNELSADAPSVLYSVDRRSGARREMTRSPDGYERDAHHRVSPAGDHLVFVRVRTEGVSDLWIAPTEDPGTARRLSHDERSIGGIAWADEGGSVLFTSNRGGAPQLWRWRLEDAAPTAVPISARNAGRIDSGPDGRLVYHEYEGNSNIWMRTPERDGPAGIARPWAETSRSDWGVRLSPDGSRLAFLSDRTGSAEVWVADLATGSARRISDERGAALDPAAWSPDGTRLVYSATRDGSFDVFVAHLGDGRIERLAATPDDDRTPSWHGADIVFASDRTGGWELWTVTPGGAARRLTDAGAFGPVSAGGEVWFTRPGTGGVWRWTSASESPSLIWADVAATDWGNWSPTPDGLLLIRALQGVTRIERFESTTGRVTVLQELHAEIPGVSGIGRAADGTLFYARVDRSEADLWLLDPAGRR